MELIDDGRLLSWLIPHPVDGARDELMTPNGVTRAGGDTPVANSSTMWRHPSPVAERFGVFEIPQNS